MLMTMFSLLLVGNIPLEATTDISRLLPLTRELGENVVFKFFYVNDMIDLRDTLYTNCYFEVWH